MRRYWILLPVMASLATQCDESPRGTAPSPIIEVEVGLESQPAGPPPDMQAFENCRDAMGADDVIASATMPGRPPPAGVNGNHVRPSWAFDDDPDTPEFDRARVPLVETPVGSNRFVARFQDVPAGIQHTMTVHDLNECRRNPTAMAGSPPADGRVTTGVTVNGTTVGTVVGNRALVFSLSADGIVVR